MPPPVPNPSKRMTANPARPVARYRPGKPVAEQESSDEEEESEEEQHQQQKKPQPKPQTRPQRQPQALRPEESEDDDEDGFVTDPEDDEEEQDAKESDSIGNTSSGIPQEASIRRAPKPPDPDNGDEDEGEGEESSDEEDESEDEESSSEEEAPRRKFQRPTFIKKSDRQQLQSTRNPTVEPNTTTTSQPSESTRQPSTEIDEQTRRLAQADLLIKDKLERDVIARAQGKKAWDDDDDLLPENLVDDTDGLDPEAEYAAWKLRELKRLKRDREALVAREKEIEEIERRRNLTAEEREKEDREYLDKQKQEREEGRSDAQYLARYHHKGAFFQGDESAEILKRRDVMGARFEDQVSDKSVLPEYMRLRDMTKLGKKGRTRYTDLKGQDTGRFGEDVKRWRGSGGGNDRFGDGGAGGGSDFDTRGLDERFLPDDQRGGRAAGGGTGPTGANASAVGPRRDHEQSRGKDYSGRGDRDRYRDRRDRDRDHDDDRDSRHRERRRSYSPSGSRSRSRSPPSSRRKHSRSRSPISRKKRQIDDFRDRPRDRGGYRDMDRDRDRDRSRERDRRRES